MSGMQNSINLPTQITLDCALTKMKTFRFSWVLGIANCISSTVVFSCFKHGKGWLGIVNSYKFIAFYNDAFLWEKVAFSKEDLLPL